MNLWGNRDTVSTKTASASDILKRELSKKRRELEETALHIINARKDINELEAREAALDLEVEALEEALKKLEAK